MSTRHVSLFKPPVFLAELSKEPTSELVDFEAH